MMDKVGIYNPGGRKQDGMRFYYATQNDAQFETYKLLISGILHLTFLYLAWPQVTKTMESETMDKGGLFYFYNLNIFSTK